MSTKIDVRLDILRCVGCVIPNTCKLKLLHIFCKVCKVDESGNLKKPVKITSVKEIYLEKNI